MRVYRRRRKSAFYVFGALVVLVLGGLGFSVMDPGLRGERASIGGVEPPAVAEAPRPVSEEPARKVEAEEQAAREREAREKAEARQKAAESEAAERDEATGGGASMLAGISAPDSQDLYLTVPKMGKEGQYVANDASEATLYNGPGKITETGFPWQAGANTYIAGHVLGYEGTGSLYDFAALPSMTYGDEIYLTDANGNQYEYVVNEILTVPITDVWVTEPVPGRTMISLQTCINPPAYDLRLVVRGDLVGVTKV
jgi:sortase A